MNFENKTDQALARILLLEFKDALRRVKGACSITYHDKTTPIELLQVFPGSAAENFSNGLIQFSK